MTYGAPTPHQRLALQLLEDGPLNTLSTRTGNSLHYLKRKQLVTWTGQAWVLTDLGRGELERNTQ